MSSLREKFSELVSSRPENWGSGFRGKSLLIWATFILLLLIAIAEGFIIFMQYKVNKRIETEATKSFKKFQQHNQFKTSSRKGVYTKLQNVRFYWSQNIFVDIPELIAKATPISEKADTVNFDDLNSFVLKIYAGTALIKPAIFQRMLNESIFNYPGSNLRNVKVSISGQRVKLNGNLNFVVWIPFEMLTNLCIDQKKNTLIIKVSDLKVFGFIPAIQLIKLRPLNLDKLVKLPRNNHLMVRGNQIMIKPFGLFPPPKINGKMQNIEIQNSLFKLSFASKNPPKFSELLNNKAQNYIYLDGGNAKFARLRMTDTQVQLIDQNPQDNFEFYLADYFPKLVSSKINLQKNGSIIVQMPDY